MRARTTWRPVPSGSVSNWSSIMRRQAPSDRPKTVLSEHRVGMTSEDLSHNTTVNVPISKLINVSNPCALYILKELLLSKQYLTTCINSSSWAFWEAFRLTPTNWLECSNSLRPNGLFSWFLNSTDLSRFYSYLGQKKCQKWICKIFWIQAFELIHVLTYRIGYRAT